MQASCLVLGALCEDMVQVGSHTRRGIGGTSYYFSAAFAALGGRAGCVAKASENWILGELKSAGVRTDGVGRGFPCCFQLSYNGSQRSLRLLRHSSKITACDLPPSMNDWEGIHIGPVEAELDGSIWGQLQGRSTLTSLDIQGLTRTFNERTGEVGAAEGISPQIAQALDIADAVKFSEGEARAVLGPRSGWEDAANRLRDRGVTTVVITLGPRGSLVFEGGKTSRISPCVSQPRDWTGAGDCFMAGFAYRRLTGHGSLDAAKFGSSLAAIVIERPRPLSFPSMGEVLERMDKVETI